MAVVIVVRLLRPDFIVADSHHDVSLIQEHLTHSVLHTHTHTDDLTRTAALGHQQETGNRKQEVSPTWSWW